MAPALTEPISPTEKLTSTPATSSASPATRSSSRKFESVKNKSSNSAREKRNGNIVKNLKPTASSQRSTRAREANERHLPKNLDHISEENKTTLVENDIQGSLKENTGGQETCTANNITELKDNEPKEQMGLSTAPADDKKKNIKNSNTTGIENASKIETTKENDTSTAQLLADLTNEALTAEICLRNQLKDVDLVKAGEGNSSPLQRSNEILVLATVASGSPPVPVAPVETKEFSAHMEAQSHELKTKSSPEHTNQNKAETSLATSPSETTETQLPVKQINNDKDDNATETNASAAKLESASELPHIEKDESAKILHSTAGAVLEQGTLSAQESPIGSPCFGSTDAKKETKLKKILHVRELPPVSTDSTMTASEVEDNLEERLSQLHGTAIDSPPPNQEVDRDITLKLTQSINNSTSTTPPRTPTHHQDTLSQDMINIQQQLQNTPPTPVSQQVQSHNLQQQNCFIPQSSSSVNTMVGANIPQPFIKETEGGAAELEDQDIEEVFKVLKGFEGGTTTDLNVCDLNVLFNEVYMKMNETDIGSNSSNVPVGGSVQNSTTAIVENPSIQLVQPTELKEGMLDIEKRQQQMHRKVDFLLRRLRKQQSRYMCRHTSEKIAGLFEWISRQSSKDINHPSGAGFTDTETGGTVQDSSRYFLKIIAARPPASDWKDIQEDSVPESQITTLLRKIESVANAQQLQIALPTNSSNLTTQRKSKKALNEAQTLTSLPSTSVGGRAEDVIISTLEENVTEELSQVAGLLQTEMREIQRAIDSDATESSSGGESADEMLTYNNEQQHSLQIMKRAAWRYSTDRSAVASRWSWLLSQISDLEIKIRQHGEMHQEIVRSKRPVMCPTDNGLKPDRTNINETTEKEDFEGSACRTRGIDQAHFRKRKLIQITNMHAISKRAARPSTIKCGCQWPLTPCAVCTGRSDPTAPRDLPDTMMMSERIALLDSGYHPVLSFKEDVNNALHLEAIAKQPEWQQRVMRCQPKHIAKIVWKAERGLHSSSAKKKSETTTAKRRYIKKKDRVVNEDKSQTSAVGSNVPSPATATTRTDFAATLTKGSASSTNDAGNGTATLTTKSTTPLVANKITAKCVRNLSLHVARDRILKEPALLLPFKSSSSAQNLSTTTMSSPMTPSSECLPINYDQFNLNQIPSSLISNHSSKNNKNRKTSSASIAANSHQINHYHPHHNNNHLYNGDSNYYSLASNDWAAGSIDGNTSVKSRTTSPTHGFGSSSNSHKYERSVDRKNRTSYDIDNIVIPYSVAAATRVEILPYKEIPTPKWRLVEIEVEKKIPELDSLNPEISLQQTITTNGHVNDECLFDKLQNSNNLPQKNENTTIKTELDDLMVNEIHRDNKDDTNKDKTITANMSSNNSSDVSDKNTEIVEDKANNTTLVVDAGENDSKTSEPVSKKMKTEPIVISSQTVEKSFNDSCGELANESLDEDISDDAMVLRHERALDEERRKFKTYLKFPWSTRSRANRRIDSRNESSGANTPDPSSPASQAPCVGSGGDQESIPSPSNPSTPLTPLDTISEAGDISSSFLGVGSLTLASLISKQRQQRRRTTSTKRDREMERRDSTPDSKEFIPPYEPMQFPLTDEKLEELLSAMPLEHSAESKRFDECFLPGGGGSLKFIRHGYTSKRSSRSSTLCGSDRRATKGASKNGVKENGIDFMYDEDYDDYPKHHLAPNDDYFKADNYIDPGGGTNMDGIDEDVYGNSYNVFTRLPKNRRNDDSDGDSTETDPFQDDDPNDPEWRKGSEDRSRKKV